MGSKVPVHLALSFFNYTMDTGNQILQASIGSINIWLGNLHVCYCLASQRLQKATVWSQGKMKITIKPDSCPRCRLHITKNLKAYVLSPVVELMSTPDNVANALQRVPSVSMLPLSFKMRLLK